MEVFFALASAGDTSILLWSASANTRLSDLTDDSSRNYETRSPVAFRRNTKATMTWMTENLHRHNYCSTKHRKALSHPFIIRGKLFFTVQCNIVILTAIEATGSKIGVNVIALWFLWENNPFRWVSMLHTSFPTFVNICCCKSKNTLETH